MISIISVLPKVTVLHVLFVTFKAALFLTNFNCIMFVVCPLMSKISIMAIPDNSSMKGASIITIFCVFGMISTVITGKNGTDLLRKPKHESLESITPSNSKMFFIPMTKSTLSWISDTKVKNSNLCSCNSINHWNYKKYTNILSISHLNSLCVWKELGQCM